MKKVIFATIVAVAFAACGGGEAEDKKTEGDTATTEAPAPVVEEPVVEEPVVEDTTATATEEVAQ